MNRQDSAEILIVDDDPMLARIIQIHLERRNHRVTTAPNGLAALKLTQSRQFDLVLTDNQMPELNGVDLCRKLRQDAHYARRPLVLLTGGKEELELSYLTDELNLAGVHNKPFSPVELVDSIQAYLLAEAAG